MKFEVTIEGLVRNYPMDIVIWEQQLTKQQAEKLFDEAIEEMEVSILGRNESMDAIEYDIIFQDNFSDGKVAAEYTLDDYEIINLDGTINLDKVKDNHHIIPINVELTFQNFRRNHHFLINVIPKTNSKQEVVMEEIIREIEERNKQTGDKLILPDLIDHYKIKWKRVNENMPLKVLILGVLISGCIYIADLNNEKKTEEKKQKQLMLDYAPIVNKFSLLLSAGMSISFAWEKITLSYLDKKKNSGHQIHPAYEEMLITMNEMKDGVGEVNAYERFAFRTQNSSYRKFITLLIQNLRKSSVGIHSLLEAESKDAFENRKKMARKYGEEAGTKLLVPMLMMLAVVMAIMLVPAIISVQI